MSQLRILKIMTERADERGWVRIGRGVIAKELGVSGAAVKASIQKLVARGHLVVVESADSLSETATLYQVVPWGGDAAE